MDQVSQGINESNLRIKSPYFDVPRPNIANINSQLKIASNSLLTYLALADAYRSEDTIKNLEDKFLNTLALCKSDEDIKYLNELLKNTSLVGGYAIHFYNTHAAKINLGEINMVQDELKKKEQEKLNPVSKMVPNGIESKYFDVSYRPKNFELANACDSLISYLIIMDIKRDEEHLSSLTLQFYKTLLICKDEEDYKELTVLMNELAKIGGYAVYFNNNIKNMINEKGKEQALIYLQNNKNNNEEANTKLDEFKKEYARLELLLDDLRKSDFIEEQDVAYLLRKYNELQSNLYTFNGEIDKTYISECDEQIEETITYLKNLYRTLDEVKNLDM